jgi:hypothetical protein
MVAQDFDKIKTFIRNNTNINLVIVPSKTGFKVNDLTVKENVNKRYELVKDGRVLEEFTIRRLAVLAAVMCTKEKFMAMRQLKAFDKQLDTLLHDISLYKTLHSTTENPIHEDRYLNAQITVDNVYEQIRLLEKSVNLQ